MSSYHAKSSSGSSLRSASAAYSHRQTSKTHYEDDRSDHTSLTNRNGPTRHAAKSSIELYQDAATLVRLSSVVDPSKMAHHNSTKAKVLYTYVPKNPKGQELTTIAGEVVSILDNQSYSTYSILANSDGSPTPADTTMRKHSTTGSEAYIPPLPPPPVYDIEQSGIHWTLIRLRSGKQGLVPSIILSYSDNPIAKVWATVYVTFTYTAKSDSEIDVGAGEKISIHGTATTNGFIEARNRYNETGHVPLSFVEIPPVDLYSFPRVQAVMTALKQSEIIRKNNGELAPVNETKSLDQTERKEATTATTTVETQGEQSPTGKREHARSVSQNAMDELAVSQQHFDSHSAGTIIAPNRTAPHSQSKRISKRIVSTLATPVTRVLSHKIGNQPTADEIYDYNMKINASREATPAEPSPSPSPSPGDGGKKTQGTFPPKLDPLKNPLNNIYVYWRKVKVTSNFTAEKGDSDVMGGADDEIIDTGNQMTVSVEDEIEVTGNPTAQGWILARFVNNVHKKGFIPASYIEELNEAVNVTVYDRSGQRFRNSESGRSPQTLPGFEKTVAGAVESHKLRIKRSTCNKSVESTVLITILLIYILPIFAENPDPTSAPKHYYLWAVHFLAGLVPYIFICLYRCIQIWRRKLRWLSCSEYFTNETRHTTAFKFFRVFFYLCVVVSYLGGFIVCILLYSHIEYARKSQPTLYLACVIESVAFILTSFIAVTLLCFGCRRLLCKQCCNVRADDRYQIICQCHCCQPIALNNIATASPDAVTP